jgi:polysaccharide export outer membrane protein
MKHLLIVFLFLLSFVTVASAAEETPVVEETSAVEEMPVTEEMPAAAVIAAEYTIGVDDILDINVMQPEKLSVTVTVAPDGTVNFPYIGSVIAKGMTLPKLQEEIQKQLSSGYMKYPVVAVFLRENRSKKYFVYGEVNRPGTYPLGDNITVLKAISSAGGFTKFGSTSRVKVLRPMRDGAGYDAMKINLNAAMDGDSKADLELQADDIVVVSEGVF